jgi:hypothetical protein
MKKKELKKEIERLTKLVSEQRADIEVLISKDREFDKLMIKTKYVVERDFEQVLWNGHASITSSNGFWFTVCEFCGNKRCPHATNINYKCTNSNDVGQVGVLISD